MKFSKGDKILVEATVLAVKDNIVDYPYRISIDGAIGTVLVQEDKIREKISV